MSGVAAGISLPWTRGGGIDGLILFLRQKGFKVGASEAIDAARLVAHLAQKDPAAQPPGDPAWLMPKLRPVLCKSSEDQERFEGLFQEWSRVVRQPQRDTEPKAARPGAPEAGDALQPPVGHSNSKSRLVVWSIGALVLVAAAAWWLMTPAVVPKIDQAPVHNAPAPSLPATAPSPSGTGTRGGDEERFYGYFPAVRYNWELRPWVAGSLLGMGTLAVLGLALPLALPLLGHARLRGRRLPLDLSSLREEAQRIVPPLQADTQARLERHVAGPADLRGRLQRRPPLHVGRTLEATLRNLGVLSLRYREARLRPSYLLIVEVSAAPEGTTTEVLNDPRGRMFYRWAERLRRQGLDVDIRLARIDPQTGNAVTCRPAGTDWRLDGVDGEPLDRLPTPPVGQRMVVVSDGHLFTDASGQWRAWTRTARLHRWSQRAIFTPTEPRHWGDREDALERRERLADPGFFVLPLDESALGAWAELVVTGRLPRFTLSRAQRYPKRLRALEDAGQTDRLLDPDHPVEGLAELLDQIKFYLGENGYYWLAACAVPPIVRWELTLLLGEQYYLGAKVRPDDLSAYIARDYPRLALLPWLRCQFMPDWLRLALLDSLSPQVQEEVREVVRGKLGQIRLDAAGDDALSLEEPPGPLGGAHPPSPTRSHSDTLYLGYLAGHSPRQLMLRAPGEWRDWLAQLPTRQRAGLWADWLAALRDRLLWRRGLRFFGASRRALAWAALGLLAVAALAFGLSVTQPTALPTDIREWLYTEEGRAVAYPHEGPVRVVAFSPDGGRVVTASWDNTARLWDAQSGQALGAPMRHEGRVWHAAFSPDGRRVVTASDDNTARLWDAQSGQALGAPMRHEGRVWHAAFSPDGRRVVTASIDNTARLWDAQNGQALGAPLRHEGWVFQAAFSPDGGRVVTASDDKTARLWDAQSGEALGAPMRHEDWVRHAAFSPDGLRVVTASLDKTARLWGAQSGEALTAPLRHEGTVYHAAFSPDGRRVVTASFDNTARLWDAQSGEALGAPLRHEGGVFHAAFSPDGRRVVTASNDNTARLWGAQSGEALGAPMRHEGWVNHAAFSPDGRRVVTASVDNTARLWDAQSGQALGAPMRHEGRVWHAAFSPDGRRVVTASSDKTARLWDAQSGQALGAPMGHEYTVNHAAFSPDGRRVMTASADNTARLWDAQSGQALGAPLRHEYTVNHAAFSPDGRRVVTASDDDTARLWDAQSGQALGAPMHHEGAVTYAAFSPDGRRVVTASSDKTARLWDAQSGQALGAPMGHEDTVNHAAFSPDGGRVVTASADNTARLWDAQSSQALGAPMRHEGRVWHAAFSPDGGRVVTASADNTARLWDAQSSQALGAPMRHEGRVWHAAFSPDGRRVVTASSDKTARLWDAQSGQALGAPLRHEGPVSHAAFSPDGRRVVTAGAGLALSANSARLAPPQFSVAQMEGVSRHDSLLQNALSAWMGHALAADVPETGKAALPATDRRAGGKVGKPLEPDPKQVPAPAPPEPAQTPAPLTQQLQKTGSAQIWRIPPYPLSQSSTTRLAPTGAWELPAGLGALGVLAGLTLGQWALRRLALKRRLSEMGA